MIGKERAAARRPTSASLAVGAVLLLGLLFSLRPADPALANPAEAARQHAALLAQASRTADALQRLEDQLRTALDAARDGAVAVVGGEDPPGPRFLAAADAAAAAAEPLRDAHATLEELRGLASLSGASDPASLALARSDLTGLEAQLRATAAAGEQFAAFRRDTEEVLDRMRDALAATDASDPRSALAAANDGEERLTAVRPWEAQMSTLSVWTGTADRILSALADLARATIAHDAAAAAAARSAYEAAASGASRADRARAIAISEGAGKVSAPALEALADAMEQVQRAKADASSLAAS
jgi:hypothetical protein